MFLDSCFADWDPAELPLFPQESGEEVASETQVKLVEELARRSGEETVTKDCSKRYGKHSWRATGAVLFMLIGMVLINIMMLARWSSPVTTHYARLAPLTGFIIPESYRVLWVRGIVPISSP